MLMRSAHSLAFPLLFLACSSSSQPSDALTTADSVAIRGVQAAYVSAWLADDTAGVLATLSLDAVLLPPGQLPIAGHSTIRDYWWPRDGSTTTITGFDWTIAELGGQRGMAFMRGVSTVDWVYVKDTVHQTMTARSANLTLLRRQDDGRWTITHQMWGPSLP